MKVSIFDVAKKSGLSVVTVSRVLNKSEKVREKNRQKVMDAIKELDYHPNAAAQSLARGKTRIIGLIMTTLHDAFFDAVVKEINDVLALQGYFLALSVSQGLNTGEGHYLMQEDRVDGLILLSVLEEEKYIVELQKRKIPYVLIDNQEQQTAPSVIVDNFNGGYEATKHLIDLGHTQIAHLCGQEYFSSTKERRRGYIQALADAGLEPFAVLYGDYGVQFGYETAKKWIQGNSLPSAVFAGDDNIAIGLMNALLEAGIRVPETISVIGYDDQLIASELHPFLTTIRQPAEKIGQSAVEFLLKGIDSKMVRSITLKLKPELIIRETTGKPG
jgi:DNA-binding LacI/PurR family transcriptional regulator